MSSSISTTNFFELVCFVIGRIEPLCGASASALACSLGAPDSLLLALDLDLALDLLLRRCGERTLDDGCDDGAMDNDRPLDDEA